MKQRNIKTKWGNVGFLEKEGEGDGIVFLHGLFDSAYSWRNIIEGLENPAFALDLPGFGMSDPPLHADFSFYARVLREALKNQGIDSFHLVGHSMGGAIASCVAYQDPEKVLSLTLVAPVGFGRLWKADIVSFRPLRGILADLGSRFSNNKILTDFAYTYFVTHGQHPSQEMLSHLTDLGIKRKEGIAKALQAIASGKKNLLPRNFYTGPILSIWLKKDTRIPLKHKERLKEVLPKAQIEVWENIGHHPQAEDPVRFIESLKRFYNL